MTTSTVPAVGPAAERARTRIRNLTGLVFPESRTDALSTGLERGMRRAGTRSLDAYLSQVERDTALLDDLVADITVGETYFLRDPDQCRVMRERILPELLGRGSEPPLRIWSAGCSTGEEAYTLAILLAKADAGVPARMVGTDLSRAALDRHRTCAELVYLHGVPLGEAGLPAEAAAALRAAFYLDRTLAVAHLALAGELLRLGDEPGAERALLDRPVDVGLLERTLHSAGGDKLASATQSKPHRTTPISANNGANP